MRIAPNLLAAVRQRAEGLELDIGLYLRTLLRNAELGGGKPCAVAMPRIVATKKQDREKFTFTIPKWEYERIKKRLGPRQFRSHLEGLIIADIASGHALTLHPVPHPAAGAACPDANNG